VTEGPRADHLRLGLVFAHPDDDAFTVGGTGTPTAAWRGWSARSSSGV